MDGFVSLDINKFRDDFADLTESWTWEIQGFIDQQNRVYPIDSDTKVISTVFERLASPVLRTIAKRYGYTVETANQTTYPDFTITLYDNYKRPLHRIAIDIKTTYYQPGRAMLFTLGSYNSFLKNDTKNILYPYSTYNEHWVIGFIYSRNDAFEEYDLENMPAAGDISCPYNIENIFIREKHEIVGLRAGSGNTANIGSIKLKSPDEFKYHQGPFTHFRDAKGACDFFWQNYDKYLKEISDTQDLIMHEDFKDFA